MPANKAPNKAVSLIHDYVQENTDAKPQMWEELSDIYKETYDGIMNIGYANAKVLQKVNELGQDNPKTAMIANTFFSTIEHLTTILNDIFIKHKDRTGRVTKQDYMEYMNLGNEYQNFGMQVSNTLMAQSSACSDEYTRVFEIASSQTKKDSDKDVNVITDVAVKETPIVDNPPVSEKE